MHEKWPVATSYFWLCNYSNGPITVTKNYNVIILWGWGWGFWKKKSLKHDYMYRIDFRHRVLVKAKVEEILIPLVGKKFLA